MATNKSSAQSLKKKLKETMASSKPRNLILKVVLDGLYDEDCPLSRLRGRQHLLRRIWAEVRRYWEAAIQLPDVDREFEGCWADHVMHSVRSPASRTFAAPVSCIEDYCTYPDFPEPSGININMMPFIVGETFEECKLPEYVRPYWDLIQLCLDPQSRRKYSKKYPSDLGRVYYLTIQETEVAPGQAQRRPGLHVDSPGSVKLRRGEAAVRWGVTRGYQGWDGPGLYSRCPVTTRPSRHQHHLTPPYTAATCSIFIKFPSVL